MGKITTECEEGDHALCEGLVDSQQACECPCHEDDSEWFTNEEDE